MLVRTERLLLRSICRYSTIPKKGPVVTDDYVEEDDKYLNTQELFNELSYHPNKERTKEQVQLHDPNFQIPEELKELNNEFKWYEESKSSMKRNSSYDPKEHTLMRLLFGNLIEETRETLPRITRSVVDPDFDMDLKPLSEVSRKLGDLSIKSNILRLKRRDSLLIKSDFQRIFPSKLERQYDCRDLDFEIVKGRFANSLLSTGATYLIFPDFEHAGCYYLETLNKLLNGQSLQLEFVDPLKNYQFIQTNLLPDLNLPKYLEPLTVQNPDIQKNLSDFVHQTNINKQLPGTTSNTPPCKELFNHTVLSKQDTKSRTFDRSQACFFKNLPRHITVEELEDTLWDYNLYDLGSLSIRIISDQYWLVIFESEKERDRCIKQFDGRHWYNNSSMPIVGVEAF